MTWTKNSLWFFGCSCLFSMMNSCGFILFSVRETDSSKTCETQNIKPVPSLPWKIARETRIFMNFLVCCFGVVPQKRPCSTPQWFLTMVVFSIFPAGWKMWSRHLFHAFSTFLQMRLVLIWLVARWTYCHWIWDLRVFSSSWSPKVHGICQASWNYHFFWRSNIQSKAMVILNNFDGFSSLMVHFLGWWYNDPCVAHGAHFQQLLVWVIVSFAKFVRLCGVI